MADDPFTARSPFRPSLQPGRPGPRAVGRNEVRVRTRELHGYRFAYRMAGKGESAVVLIHGIGDSSATWADIIPGLAARYRVLAPDLLGHGASAKPRGDYSPGAYANGLRDLLSALGIERATLVGHSLGGAVAAQFAYQFPERTERLVLVGSGGIGRQVSPLLRAATLPGAELLLSAFQLPTVRWQLQMFVRIMKTLNTGLGADAPDLLRVVDALPDASSRSAFVRTLRAVVDWRGQVGTLLDRCYLTQGMPTMLVWGGRDMVVPALHAGLGHVSMPGSRLEIFEDAGHFPFHTDPERFLGVLHDFIGRTRPARFSPEEWRQLLRPRRAHTRTRGARPLQGRATG
ncbi:alpha/beta fold hydrolase [Streptomyces heilongjiangensis]|uniref:alpha/beta fold hydrolase n=1 Tax=Streptomyces heilongjiangensis TaxID=945052 RepID=UPI00233000D6|nr:alpha/beta hydrolase [Streptomyces heilongjiangensis]MDC2950560.1 alpha/beta hydrolase [Streptomyces heilongjiangensis]